MSDTTASLHRQISSAGDFQSVVRTMKALAASSIGQYESYTGFDVPLEEVWRMEVL